MISANKDQQVYFEKDEKIYIFKNQDDYKRFIFLITDPKNDVVISDFIIDSELVDERLLGICKKYKEFFENFINAKEEIKKSVNEELSNL